MRFQALLSAVLLFAAALSLPARAGMFDDEEARARVEALRAEHAELVLSLIHISEPTRPY